MTAFDLDRASLALTVEALEKTYEDRTKALDRWGNKLGTALNEVSARLTTNDLVTLNAAVERDGLTPAEAAARWWDG